MKESVWGYYLAILGLLVCSVMILMSNMTTTNQQDYYLLKEISNAAMIDSIDYGYYRKYGETKINTEKFVENFIRRFGQSVSKNNSYKIDFYGIYENPPRVSIKITSSTGDFAIAGDSSNIDVVNKIDVILEANNKMVYSKVFYTLPYAQCLEKNSTMDSDGYCKFSTESDINTEFVYQEIVESLKERVENAGLTFNENKIKILNAHFLKKISTQDEIEEYENQYLSEFGYQKNYGSMHLVDNISEYVAESVKEVKFTVLDTPTNKKILSMSARFKCGDSVFENTDVNSPYYKACFVGVKYKIDFYYDITL